VAQVQATIENVPQNPGTAFTVSGNTITFDGAPPSGTNNIYVYYTSPITQVIAPSQGTVFPSTLSTGGPFWNTSGNLGVGTSSPATYNGKLVVKTSDQAVIGYFGGTTYAARLGANSSYAVIEGVDAATGVSSYQPLQIGGSLLKFDTGGTERMRIDSAGRVTTPSQPAFNANNSGNFTISSETSITYNTAQWNTGSNYSTATGRFTAPVTGYYLLFHKLASNTTNVFEPKIYINGTEVARAYSPNTSSNGKTITVSTIWYMSASDYAQPYAYVPGSTTFYGSGSVQSSFYGYLLG
jgi:hypothetical protein